MVGGEQRDELFSWGDLGRFAYGIVHHNEDYQMRDGGPAFPHVIEEEYDTGYHLTDVHEGMTLRDWFAGQALSRLVHVGERDPDEVAELAYAIADAMLNERKVEP